MRALLTVPIAAAICTLAASPAAADPAPRAYAIVVGNNHGGAGQEPLRYAERDAGSVAELLGDIGGYAPDDVVLLVRSSADDLRAALAKVRERIEADAAAGRQSRLLFYYSGHARAPALNLGADEMSIDELREQLTTVPATLTVVILDACQSGAFSRIKGAEPASDFSLNSVSRLDAAGLAVMASSTGTELSQESERLRSSYFTHYLLVGLRGAGDANGDGRVSVDEAYRYAYDRTLVATAKTAVGRQHVTLETDLKGKGDVPLSWPERADAHLMLPSALRGDLVIERGGAVIAEVAKAAGEPVKIALGAGSYRVVLHRDGGAEQCSFQLGRDQSLQFDDSKCEPIAVEEAVAKGAAEPSGPTWTVELGLGFVVPRSDRYVDRLGDFGYQEDFFIGGHYSLAVTRRIAEHVHVVANAGNLGSDAYRRDGDTETLRFEWSSQGLGLGLRGEYSLAGGVLVPFAEAGGGAVRARTKLFGETTPAVYETHWGYYVGADVGLAVMPWKQLGFVAKLGFTAAPTIENELGDVHDVGGVVFDLGLRGAM